MTNKIMMHALFQLYFEPPHWSTKSKQITEVMNTTVPKGSNRLIFSYQQIFCSDMSCGGGALNKNIIPMTTTAPSGRLI